MDPLLSKFVIVMDQVIQVQFFNPSGPLASQGLFYYGSIAPAPGGPLHRHINELCMGGDQTIIVEI